VPKRPVAFDFNDFDFDFNDIVFVLHHRCGILPPLIESFARGESFASPYAQASTRRTPTPPRGAAPS
jgi:hypothetical protein